MPLHQSQSFDGFGFGRYGGSGEHVVQNQCPKRKIDICERTQLEDIYENWDLKNEHNESIPKRQCQWLSNERHTSDFHQKETNGEDVNMEEDREVVATSEISSNTCNSRMLSQCCQAKGNETVQPSVSMDSDSSTPESHHTPNRKSAPWSIAQEKARRCGYLSCRGLRPSPVSGRLYCHCSASWRGMYGLDARYNTDYY